MMSIENIKQTNKEQEEKAREMNTQPYVAKTNGDKGVRAAPHIGDFKPIGWKQVDTFFVDNSGMGTDDEAALTARQFLTKVKQNRGYAIIEAGQFQVVIAEYVRE